MTCILYVYRKLRTIFCVIKICELRFQAILSITFRADDIKHKLRQTHKIKMRVTYNKSATGKNCVREQPYSLILNFKPVAVL